MIMPQTSTVNFIRFYLAFTEKNSPKSDLLKRSVKRCLRAAIGSDFLGGSGNIACISRCTTELLLGCHDCSRLPRNGTHLAGNLL